MLVSYEPIISRTRMSVAATAIGQTMVSGSQQARVGHYWRSYAQATLTLLARSPRSPTWYPGLQSLFIVLACKGQPFATQRLDWYRDAQRPIGCIVSLCSQAARRSRSCKIRTLAGSSDMSDRSACHPIYSTMPKMCDGGSSCTLRLPPVGD